MGVKIGSNNIGDVYVGSSKISEIYVGNNLVYTAGGDEPIVANQDYILNVTKETRNTYANSTTYSDKFIAFSVYGGTSGMTITYDGITKTVSASATETITFGKYLGVDDGTADTGDITFSGTGYVKTVSISTGKSTSSYVNCVNSVVQYFGQNMSSWSMSGQTRLQTFKIPSHITEIPEVAFSGCTSLTTVKIPSAITRIWRAAFYGCSNLTNAKLNMSITRINDEAFYGCSKLPYITLPNTLLSIGSKAFNGCSKITQVNIPNTTTSIGTSAFGGCTLLEVFNIGSGLVNDGYMFFLGTASSNAILGGCWALKEINVDANNTDFSSVDGILFNKNKTTLFAYPYSKQGVTSYTIPNTVTTLEMDCFYHQLVLETLTIPSSITALPGGMCDGMYTVQNGKIGSLKTINIPSSITSFGTTCLGMVEKVYYNGTLSQYMDISTSSLIYDTSLNFNSFDLYINNTKLTQVTVNKNDINVFACTSIEKLIIASNVTSIKASAFYNCGYLTTVQFMHNDITTLATVGGASFKGQGTIPDYSTENVQYQFVDTQANVEAWGKFTTTNFTNTTYHAYTP